MVSRWLAMVTICCSAVAPLAADAPTRPSTAPAVSGKDPRPIISLSFDKVPLREAFEQFAEQGHVILRVDADAPEDFWRRHKDGSVTISIKQLSYWHALHRMCVVAGLTANESAPGVLVISERPPAASNRPSLVYGLFSMQAGGISDSKTIVLGSHPRSGQDCRIWFDVNALAGLRALRCEGLNLIELTDPAGKPIELARKWRPVFPFKDNRWELQLDLKPGPTVSEIGKIKGELSIELADTSSNVEVDNILKADKVERQIGSLHFVITTKAAEGGCDVDVDVRDDRGDIAIWAGTIDATTPKLFDAHGRNFVWAGGGKHTVDKSTVSRTNRFRRSSGLKIKDPPGEPEKLVWEIVTAGQTIALPFEFKNLAIP